MTEPKSGHVSLIIDPQHSCYVYESKADGVMVTVWSKHKKRMRRFEVNTWLDLAKADIMEKIIKCE